MRTLVIAVCLVAAVGCRTTERLHNAPPQLTDVDSKGAHQSALSVHRSRFFSMLNLVRYSAPTYSLEELTQASEIIVTGRIVNVHEGYKIDFREGASHPMYTLVLEVQPVVTHKGGAKSTLLVEMYKSPLVDAEQLAKDAPERPVTLFLAKAERNEAVYSYTKLGDGLPDGSDLLQLRSPTGLVPGENPADYRPEGYETTLQIGELFPAGETRGVTPDEIAAVVESPTPDGEPMRQ